MSPSISPYHDHEAVVGEIGTATTGITAGSTSSATTNNTYSNTTTAATGSENTRKISEKGAFVKDFLLHRIARLGPVMWLSLLLFIPISVVQSQQKTDDFKGNITLLVLSYILTSLFMQTWLFLG